MKDADPAVYLFLIILAVGVLLLVISTVWIWNGIQTLRWKLTYAYIENSEYSGTDQQTWAKLGTRLLFGFLSSAPSHRATIRYRYHVSDKEFLGTRVQVGMMSSSDRERIEAFLEQNSAGEVIEVYYNPAAPNKSVILKGPATDSVKLLCLGIVMTAIGGYISSVFLSC